MDIIIVTVMYGWKNMITMMWQLNIVQLYNCILSSELINKNNYKKYGYCGYSGAAAEFVKFRNFNGQLEQNLEAGSKF